MKLAKRLQKAEKDISDVKNADRIRVRKSKIHIKLKKKQRPSTTVSPFLSVKRHRVVTSAETRLHASFPGSAYLF